ncbi:MAG TPA: cytochrome c3 family protein [Anaeromyxobacter sp.]
MLSRIPTRAALVAAVLLLLALAPRRGGAGDWHQGALLLCTDCHTTHNSSNGGPMRYDASPALTTYLLRGADQLSLCLACHDGSQPGAPDVLAPVGYASNPAAGTFASRDGSAGFGHLLLGTAQQVPLGSKQMTLTCSSCHDSHGNGNYRNLRFRPGGSVDPDLVLSVDQVKRPDGTNPADVYDGSNLVYRSGMTAWCVDCHDQAPSGHAAHSNDKTIFGSTIASFDAWSAATGVRVPVENPTDPRIPSSDDRIECMTCHYGHGSTTDALRQPNGPNTLCMQCHVQ